MFRPKASGGFCPGLLCGPCLGGVKERAARAALSDAGARGGGPAPGLDKTKDERKPMMMRTTIAVFATLLGACAAAGQPADARPEDISQWEPTRLVGPQDKSLTYTYPMETPDGEMLLFYRLGGAVGNSPLAVSRSTDRGETWKAPRILVDYGANKGAGSVKIHDAVYDAKTGRVHLWIYERDNTERPKWYAHYCQYDPDLDRMFALVGVFLAPPTTRPSLAEGFRRGPHGKVGVNYFRSADAATVAFVAADSVDSTNVDLGERGDRVRVREETDEPTNHNAPSTEQSLLA